MRFFALWFSWRHLCVEVSTPRSWTVALHNNELLPVQVSMFNGCHLVGLVFNLVVVNQPSWNPTIFRSGEARNLMGDGCGIGRSLAFSFSLVCFTRGVYIWCFDQLRAGCNCTIQPVAPTIVVSRAAPPFAVAKNAACGNKSPTKWKRERWRLCFYNVMYKACTSARLHNNIIQLVVECIKYTNTCTNYTNCYTRLYKLLQKLVQTVQTIHY